MALPNAPDYGMHNLCNLYHDEAKGYLRGSFMFWTFWCFKLTDEQQAEFVNRGDDAPSWRLACTMRNPKPPRD